MFEKLTKTPDSVHRLVGKSPWRVTPSSVALILFAGVCCWLCFGAAFGAEGDGKAPKEVRASRFVVIDDHGKERGELGLLPGGQVGVVIRGKDSGTALSLYFDDKGMPRFEFQNSKGEALLDLGLLDDQSPAFVMRDGEGRRRLGIIVTPRQTVAIGLYDMDKVDRCSIAVGADGHPQIALKDEAGRLRGSIMLDSKGECALDLYDREGRERVVFQVNAEGKADGAVFGPDGKAKWSSGKP